MYHAHFVRRAGDLRRGQTWDVGNYIDTSIWAMGALCEVEPNVVLFIYMDSWNDTLRGQFFRVTDQSLEPVPPSQS